VRSPEVLGFELEIKSEFNWKMKSQKIQRLEFVSDKIEGGDSKREVIYIYFGHPMKNEIVWGSPWEVAMARVGAPWPAMGARQRGRGSGERGRGAAAGGTRREGGLLGEEAPWGGAAMEEGSRPFIYSCMLLLSVTCCCTWEGRRKEEGEREKKRKGRKRKEKNMENFPNLKIIWEKNKRQFMKLVKKLFLYKKGINLIVIK
jgi:hypothetical protein